MAHETLLYNGTHKLTKVIAPPSQEDIYNCPHYFGMSYEQVKWSGPPRFLINLLDQFPFDGRKNVLRICPQDFRQGIATIDGTYWHVDHSVRLLRLNQTEWKAYAKTPDEFHLMLISWGAGCKTEFLDSPMELPAKIVEDRYRSDWKVALEKRLSEDPPKIVTVEKNQLVEYTSRDIHREDGVVHSTGLRLMVAALDCDDIQGNVRIFASIKELDVARGEPVWLPSCDTMSTDKPNTAAIAMPRKAVEVGPGN